MPELCPKHHVELSEFTFQDGNGISSDYECQLCKINHDTVPIKTVDYQKQIQLIIFNLVRYPISSPKDLQSLADDIYGLCRYAEATQKGKIKNEITTLLSH